MRLNTLGKVRRALQAVDVFLTRRNYRTPYFTPPEPDAAWRRWEAFFRSLDLDPAGAAYVRTHLQRLVQTLAIVPRPQGPSRVLELGCYMQITPALALEIGYAEVRGGYYGPLGRTERKTAMVNGNSFECQVDLFDAERDPFPYPDGHFQCVLACEIIEHLKLDPMHMLLEIRRILAPGGALVLTTPNCASLGSVIRLLHGFQSPQIFSCYPHPEKSGGDSPHVREYTPFELRRLLESAGFETGLLFTDRIDGYEEGTWAYELLKRNGFDTEMRGEQIYCRARRSEAGPVERYPRFLYEA